MKYLEFVGLFTFSILSSMAQASSPKTVLSCWLKVPRVGAAFQVRLVTIANSKALQVIVSKKAVRPGAEPVVILNSAVSELDQELSVIYFNKAQKVYLVVNQDEVNPDGTIQAEIKSPAFTSQLKCK